MYGIIKFIHLFRWKRQRQERVQMQGKRQSDKIMRMALSFDKSGCSFCTGQAVSSSSVDDELNRFERLKQAFMHTGHCDRLGKEAGRKAAFRHFYLLWATQFSGRVIALYRLHDFDFQPFPLKKKRRKKSVARILYLGNSWISSVI